MNYKKLNMNNAVKVKLNEVGHKEMERQHYELYESLSLKSEGFQRKTVDEDGFSIFQLHTLMNTFGHMMTCGGEMPFDDLSIYIAEVNLKDA